MVSSSYDRCVIVTRKTQLEELIARFNTASQAEFYLKSVGDDFSLIKKRHETYVAALAQLKRSLPTELKFSVIDRTLLPQFDFQDDIVLAIGQDGLVSNTAKYLRSQPLIGINPDPDGYEGILLPWTVDQAPAAVARSLKMSSNLQQVTLAQATTNDGRELLAFNDFFVGQAGHASASYELYHMQSHELQSSSGIIVSTGAGTTGWMRSVYTGAQHVANSLHEERDFEAVMPDLDRSADALIFAVREPWPSKRTGTDLVFGYITPDHPLQVHSRMAANGVIFSDGIEWDFLEFNAGTHVTISIAAHKTQLVVP
jgi:NAD kinase